MGNPHTNPKTEMGKPSTSGMPFSLQNKQPSFESDPSLTFIDVRGSWTSEYMNMCEKGSLSRISNKCYVATSLKRWTNEAHERKDENEWRWMKEANKERGEQGRRRMKEGEWRKSWTKEGGEGSLVDNRLILISLSLSLSLSHTHTHTMV